MACHEKTNIIFEHSAGLRPVQSTLGIAHSVLRLVCSCLIMETHSMKLMFFPEMVWNSVVSSAKRDKHHSFQDLAALLSESGWSTA